MKEETFKILFWNGRILNQRYHQPPLHNTPSQIRGIWMDEICGYTFSRKGDDARQICLMVWGPEILLEQTFLGQKPHSLIGE